LFSQEIRMEIRTFGFYFLLGIILVIAFKFYLIIDVFFPSIAAACILAFLFAPIYRYFLKITKRKSLSAFLVIFINFTLILVPMIIIGSAVQEQIQFLFTEDTIGSIRSALQNFENLMYNKFNIQLKDYYLTDLFPKLITTTQEAITSLGPKMIYSITGLILSTFVTFFLMFYLLINSKQVIATFRNYFPLSYKNCDALLREIKKDTKNLIQGHLLIGIIQGTLGGIGFLILGISGVILWGFAMMVVSFIPLLGTIIIWFPACLLLALRGHYFESVCLFLWGSIIVGTTDNIIRPKLVSSLGKIHPVTVLLGVFIGIKEWGLVGLVIGPLTISVLLTLIKMFREEYLEE
ncbi:AI-2E family transporter, partial [Candidatus Latescibacterota bacterium]